MKKWICSLLVLALLLSTGVMTASATADNPFYDEPDDLEFDEYLPGYQELPPEEQPQAPEAENPEEIPEQPQTEEAPAPAAGCGDNLQWSLQDGVLTVSGVGPMYDFTETNAPWEPWRSEIRTVILQSGVSTVGAAAFRDYDSLNSVEFGSGMAVLGSGCFAGCDNLTELSFPEGFRILGEECLYNCLNLKTVNFSGSMPSFKLNCLWGTHATVVYPAAQPWPINQVQKLSKSFQGRIQFRLSDGTDPLAGTTRSPEETEKQTEPALTEPKPTLEVKLPVAETVPETAAPAETVRPAEAPEATREFVTLPEAQEENSGFSATVLAILIVVAVASGCGVVWLLVRMTRSSRKDFTGDFSEILLEDEKKPARRKPTQAQKAAGKKQGSRKK